MHWIDFHALHGIPTALVRFPLVSYPTRWSFSFILGPLHWSSIFLTSREQRNIVQLCTTLSYAKPTYAQQTTLQRQAKWLKHSLQLCSAIISDNKENGKFVHDVIWEPPRPPSPYFNDWHSKLVPPKRKKINWIWIHTTACWEQQGATKTFKPHWNMNENSFLRIIFEPSRLPPVTLLTPFWKSHWVFVA